MWPFDDCLLRVLEVCEGEGEDSGVLEKWVLSILEVVISSVCRRGFPAYGDEKRLSFAFLNW